MDTRKEKTFVHKQIAEDLLEMLYIAWKDERKITILDICRRFQFTQAEAMELQEYLMEKGYLKEIQGETVELTEIGKHMGAQYLEKSDYLAQFLQMICNMDEQKAKENACELEHVVNTEVMEGICEFLKFGDTYDRIIRGFDFQSEFTEGWYAFTMCIYNLEECYPKVLADEFFLFEDQVWLEVSEKRCYFYLEPKGTISLSSIWYQEQEIWEKAKWTERGFQIPADILLVTINLDVPVMEGDGLIAFTEAHEMPGEENCRQLNVHIWHSNKEENDHGSGRNI